MIKKGLKVLLITDAWGTLAISMIGPIYAIFVEEIGGDILDASWAYFAFMITSAVVMYLISHWEDRSLHKEKFVFLGYVLLSLGCLSYIFVYNQFGLIVTQMILGVSFAVLNPAYDAMYAKYVDKKFEASQWGDWEAMGYLVTALAALVGGYIASAYGFRTLFVCMFVAAIISAVVSLYLFKGEKFLES